MLLAVLRHYSLFASITVFFRIPGDAGKTDESDEWGIVEAAVVQQFRPIPSQVRLTSTAHGVTVSLALSVASCHRASPNLRIQRTCATWYFSVNSGGHRSVNSYQCYAAQPPMFAIGLVTSTLFDAYVADRLEVAAHCHAERLNGSKLRWSPHLLTVSIGSLASTSTTKSEDGEGAATVDIPEVPERLMGSGRVKDVQAIATEQDKELPEERQSRPDEVCEIGVAPATMPTRRLPLFKVKARYLDYEQSDAYVTKRSRNIERRRARQSSPLESVQQKLHGSSVHTCP
ncbi:unnamed protein product [Phytophthora lilii]|uniref:Unnamed protein product n=1 Tax=Phytophthora lilii TaxID=2077276 RepID=A0A9W6WPY7_9STRA|nr:unnamed protein product [Phytophthora lilii]